MPKRFGFGFLEDAVEAVVTGDVPQSSNKKIWIIVGVVVLILIGVLIFFLVKKSKFGDTSAKPAGINHPNGFAVMSARNTSGSWSYGLKNSQGEWVVSDNKGGFTSSKQASYPFSASGVDLYYKGKRLQYNNNGTISLVV